MSISKVYFRFGLLFAAVFAVSVIATPDDIVAPAAQVETNDIQEPVAAQRLVRSAPATRKPAVKKTDGSVAKKKVAVKKATGNKTKPVAVLKKAGAKGKPAKKGATKTKTGDGKPFVVKKKVASKGGKAKANPGKKLPELKVEGVKNTVGVIG